MSELSLVVSQPRGYLYSLRQETALRDFYLEITASPSICRGADEYGLLVRLVSTQDFLRFGLNCRGEARLDRLSGGEASSPFPPELSGAVPPGAPSTSRLAVWALGKELRFYVDKQFTAGASAPEVLVEQVIMRLKELGAEHVEEGGGQRETIVFPLPKVLQE